MKIAFSVKDKKRIKICAILIVIGLLIIGATFSPFLNPKQCPDSYTQQQVNDSDCIIGANIGAGAMYLLGMGLTVISGLGLGISLLLAFAASTNKPYIVLLVAALTTGFIGLASWYIFINVPAMKTAEYSEEVQKRGTNFVEYKNIPKIGSISGKSAAITSRPGAGNASSITINLHDCSPGAAKVKHSTGSTYFAFNGIRNENIQGYNFNNCVFYFGIEMENSNWGGLLNIKCESPILDTLAQNQKEFPVTDKGIQFGDFLEKYCVDLMTGLGFGV